jgi:uncharacterized NAD(P)/FAD-binding protein YdhS
MATRARLIVVGGGFTGAALIVHVIRAATRPLDIDVIEPRAELGRGIAYGTRDPSHRINVPSDRLSLFKEQSDHFTRWLYMAGYLPDEASTDSRGLHYVARGAYGAYVLDILKQTLEAAGPAVRLRHHRARAASIHSVGTGWKVDLSSGDRLIADKVALCVGHSEPAPPCPISSDALRHPSFFANPWASEVVSAIGRRDSVLVVGTGLTMADVIATLSEAEYRGRVTAISRRGLLARPHGLFLDDIDILDGPAPNTAIGLLQLARRRIDQLEPRVGWQPAVDALRHKLSQIWPPLPPSQQRRIVRHLLPFWEVHRFRIAPQLDQLVENWRRQGRLVVEQAGLASLDVQQGKLAASLRRRGGRTAKQSFDAVVLCVGPGKAIARDPLIAQILREELARPDGVGVGVAVDEQSRLISGYGATHASLWALGPMTRGSFGEMTGAPDIARQIERISATVAGY